MADTDGKVLRSTGGGDGPSGDDPYIPGNAPSPGGVEPAPLDEREQEAAEIAHRDPKGQRGPSYERNRGREDGADGGSSDSHNSLSHADSGDEGVSRK
ncbi:hypothetical protein [Fimbriimonas ginsengisoli]|uniref:Uncharacterized protein n=1 Tax=Fimbriimonas ginsengisoli Gsoil 348 TaxID=661478 RepID=A0A068NJW7_FIMGI|nr:hypothetical protein [Fimbriimonas ginsengisoli]AIE83888.1 hypothetical protein OP10G_0520 [Fimbriimonas ginsengisoli Gsoil 348]